MSKATLEFDLTDNTERAEFTRAATADQAYGALWDIAQELFRPARKHGYNDKVLSALLEHPEVATAIAMLEDEFYRILEANEVSLNDYA